MNQLLQKIGDFQFDFVFYVAGVDVHFEDRLGKLNITETGIRKREELVINNFFKKIYLYVVSLEEGITIISNN